MPAHLRRLKPYLIGVPAGLAIWVLIVLAVAFLQGSGQPVAILAFRGTEAALDAVVAAGGSILEVRRNAVVAISDDPRFVRRLYALAPLIVVPAPGGCGFGVKRPKASG